VGAMRRVKAGEEKYAIHEPVDLHTNRRVNGSTPYFKLDKAKAVLSLDCDFIGSEADAHQLIRGFSAGRRIQKASDPMNRLYAVEGLMTLTGMNADHRLRVPTSQVATVAAHRAARVAPQNQQVASLAAKLPLSSLISPFDATNAGAKKKAEDRQKFLEGWIAECAADLLANPGASLVLAGYRQPQAVH